MTWFYRNAHTTVQDIIQDIDTALQAEGWVQLDPLDLNLATFDVVYSSTGVLDDAQVFIRLTRDTNTLYAQAYSWWDSTAHVGYNETGSIGTTYLNLGYTAASWAGRVNPYELSLAFYDEDTVVDLAYFGFGQLNRSQSLPARTSGWGRTTAGISALDTELPVDRDLRGSVLIGQVITVVSQDSDAAENRTVKGLTASSILIDALDNDYDAGAIVGANPMPVYCMRGEPYGAGVRFINRMIFNGNYQYTGPTDQQAHPYCMAPGPQGGLDGFVADQAYTFPLYLVDLDTTTILGTYHHIAATIAGGFKEYLYIRGGVDPGDRFLSLFPASMPVSSGQFQYVLGSDAVFV